MSIPYAGVRETYRFDEDMETWLCMIDCGGLGAARRAGGCYWALFMAHIDLIEISVAVLAE